MKRLFFFSFVLMMLGLLLFVFTLPAFSQTISQGNGDLRIMTYNIDEGTDYIEVQQATSGPAFAIAIGQTITQVRAIDTNSRMRAVARQIVAAAPTLVSLQELDKWYSGPLGPTGCGPLTLEYDMLATLMKALENEGAHYTIAAVGKQWDFTGPYAMPGFIPPSNFLCVGVKNYVAILARTDVPQLKWNNAQTQQYAAALQFPVPGQPGVYIPMPRAWVSVDASLNGKPFRLIGTHLDSVVHPIRRAQGQELRLGPANTSLPAIIAMDSNAQAAPLPQEDTYTDFLSAGFLDVWAEKFPGVPGYTTGQDQFLDNPVSKLNQRIDLILTFGPVVAQRIALFGATQASKTPEGLWPSDHAAVVAQLNVQKHY